MESSNSIGPPDLLHATGAQRRLDSIWWRFKIEPLAGCLRVNRFFCGGACEWIQEAWVRQQLQLQEREGAREREREGEEGWEGPSRGPTHSVRARDLSGQSGSRRHSLPAGIG